MASKDNTAIYDDVTRNSVLSSINLSTLLASAGALTKIQTITASNQAAVQFVSQLSSTYDNYLITLEGVIPVTLTGVSLLLNFGTASSFFTGYSQAGVGKTAAGGNISVSGTAQSNLALSDAVFTGPGSGIVYISGANNASSSAMAVALMAYGNTTPGLGVGVFGGQWTGSSPPITSVEFSFSTGNVSLGTFKLYGIQN